MINNSNKTFGTVTKLFHWISAILILGMLTAGFTMTNMADSPQKFEFYAMHKATGVIVLGIITLRLMWKIISEPVLTAPNVPFIYQALARLNHIAIYIFLIIMPSSGLLMSLYAGRSISIFGFYEIESFTKSLPIADFFHTIHITSAWILVCLIAIHLSAAVFHYFIRKDHVVQGMM